HVGIVRAEPDRRFQMQEGSLRSARKDECGTETVMCKCQAWVKVQCNLQLGDCRSIIAAEIANSSQGAMRTGIVSIKSDSLLSRFKSALAPVILGVSKPVDDFVVICLGEARVGGTQIGINANGFLEKVSSLRQIVLCVPIKMEHAALVSAPSVQVVSLFDACSFPLRPAQFGLDTADNR